MHAVVMVAGKSTRTYPLTLTRPKPVLPIINKPLIFYNLDQLYGIVDSVVFIVGYRKEMIEELVGDEYRGMKIIYQEQKEQLGTGHAVLQAAPHITDRFIVMNGDDLFHGDDIKKLIEHPYGALAKQVDDPSQFGIMEIDNRSYLVNFIEKPKTYISNLVNVGCYILEPEIFDILARTPKSERGEIELPGAILNASKQHPVKVVILSQYWLPTGFPWDLLNTQAQMFSNWRENNVNGIVEDGAFMQGNVQIGEGTVVKSGAQIIGPASIGHHCLIESEAYIGPYTSIGHGTVVRPRCLIEDAIVFDGVTIDHASIIRHAVIGKGSSIGERSHLISHHPHDKTIKSMVKGKWIDTHLNALGAILADNVTLGAQTTILPGMKIWPGITTDIGQVVDSDLVE